MEEIEVGTRSVEQPAAGDGQIDVTGRLELQSQEIS